MKKIPALLLIFVLMFSAGCAAKSDPATEQAAKKDSQEASWEAENFLAKENEAANTVDSLTANTDHEIVIDDAADSVFDGVHPLATAKWSVVTAPQGTVALQSMLNFYNNDVGDQIRASMEEIAQYAKEDLSSGAHLTDPYEVVETTSVCRNDEVVLSFKRETYSYSGGAHGMNTIQGDCFDSQTGRRINLQDVLVDPGFVAERMIELLEPEAEEKELYDGWQDIIRKAVRSEGGLSVAWVLDETGIEFYFQPYELAPYATGVITFSLRYADHEDFFVPRFIVAETSRQPIEQEDIRSELRRDTDTP